MLMLTYGTLDQVGNMTYCTIGPDREKEPFKYPEFVHNHYQRRDAAIDSHNSRHQDPISLEEAWITSCWENKVFAYLMATSEVNTNLAQSEFGHAEAQRPQLEFRGLLANDLINNEYLQEESGTSFSRSSKCKRDIDGHELVKFPPNQKFKNNRIVKSKSKYPYNHCVCK